MMESILYRPIGVQSHMSRGFLFHVNRHVCFSGLDELKASYQCSDRFVVTQINRGRALLVHRYAMLTTRVADRHIRKKY